MSARHQTGFTYLMLMWWVAVSGVLVTALSQSWTIDARRERESDLSFKGEQIRLAIEAYAKVQVSPGVSTYPQHLEDLLEDRRQGETKHHLRRVWRDPITGGQWGLIKSKDGGIQGVFSTSGKSPLHPPEGVNSYADWRFQSGGLTPKSAEPGVSANFPDGITNSPVAATASSSMR